MSFKRGDVVLAKDLHGERDVVYLLLRVAEGMYTDLGRVRAWECLVLHSDYPGLCPGQLATPTEDFLLSGGLL